MADGYQTLALALRQTLPPTCRRADIAEINPAIWSFITLHHTYAVFPVFPSFASPDPKEPRVPAFHSVILTIFRPCSRKCR
jgi:hypothetical protein